MVSIRNSIFLISIWLWIAQRKSAHCWLHFPALFPICVLSSRVYFLPKHLSTLSYHLLPLPLVFNPSPHSHLPSNISHSPFHLPLHSLFNFSPLPTILSSLNNYFSWRCLLSFRHCTPKGNMIYLRSTDRKTYCWHAYKHTTISVEKGTQIIQN